MKVSPAARRRAHAEVILRRRLHSERCAPFRKDILGYATEVLGAELTAGQQSSLVALQGRRRVAVKASHSIGKTYLAAVAICWWYDCWDQHIAYVTAPTWPQALGLTFKQVKLLRRQRNLPGIIQETGWIKDEDPIAAAGHFIHVLNAESGEGFQGEHTAPMLIVMEEGPGIPPYIWAASDGLMTHPDNKILAIGNPTDEATPFGAACRLPSWDVRTISVFDHPNIAAELAGLRRPIENAVSLTWLKEMMEANCTVVSEPAGDTFEFLPLPAIEEALARAPNPDSPPPDPAKLPFLGSLPPGDGGGGGLVTEERWTYLPNSVFQGRAMGLFPTQPAEQVVPRNWLAALLPLAMQGWPELGVDVARHGDDRTTICCRRGSAVLFLREVRQMDLAVVTGAIRLAASEAAANAGMDPRSVPIRIDITGGLGAGPADYLASEGYAVEGVNSSSLAYDAETYPNRRSELWFSTRERVRTRDMDLSRLPYDLRVRLEGELATPKWKPDPRGRKVVEPKEVTKKKLKASPDLADALNLAFSPPRPVHETEVEEEPYGARI